MAEKKKAGPAKINPKDYGFNSKDWGKVNKQVRDWIQLNKDLWNNLTKYEQRALKTSRDMVKNAKETSMAAESVRNLSREHAKVIKDMGVTTKSNLAMQAQMAAMGVKAIKLDQKSDALSKKRFKVIEGTVDITGDYLANMDAIGTDEFRSLDINKKIREAVKAKLPDEEQYLRYLKAEHDVQKKLNAEITSQADLIKKPFEWMDSMVQRVPIFGEMLSKKIDLTGMGQEYAEKFVESSKLAAEAQKELLLNAEGFFTASSGEVWKQDTGKGSPTESAKEQLKAQGKIGPMMKKMGPYALGAAAAMGAMAISAFKFAKDLGVGFTQISPGMMLFREETKALLDEFGSVNDISTESLWTMKKASFFSGVQASDMAKMAMLQTSITGDTKEMALDKQAKFMKEIKDQGLSASKVMGDLASHADMFANYAKDGGKNMEEAAKQAAQMGLSLDATSSVAESLLDWETSIAAEQEASMILGRSINLDKARQLAYSGDLAEMMTEVKNQAGGEAEFAKMSVVQRQALGDAIGLSGANLAEFVKTQDASNKAQSSGVGKWAMWGAIILGVLGAIAGALIITGVGLGILGGMATGAVIGGALGAGIFAAAYGISSMFAGDVLGEAGKTTQISPKEGGIYNLSKNDDFMAGPGIASGGGGTVVNNSGLESKLDQLISIAAKQPTSELVTDQARRQKSAIEGAFAQR